LADNWSNPDSDPPVAPAFRGFPAEVPSIPTPPEFDWIGRGNGTPSKRREDFINSRPKLVPLIGNRDLSKQRGTDIDQALYLRKVTLISLETRLLTWKLNF